VDLRAGLDDVEKRKFLNLPGLELRPLGRPARSQSLYRLCYPGFCSVHVPLETQILYFGQYLNFCTGFQVFLSVTPCSLVKVYRRFGGTYSLHLWVKRVSKASTLSYFFHVVCLTYFSPHKIKAVRSSETYLNLTGLRDDICKNIILFIVASICVIIYLFIY
jgi:hypothetical protein